MPLEPFTESSQGHTMDLITNLRGRLKNTALPLTNGLLPVFESVSNAIHAIEDARVPMARGSVTLEVVRNGQTSFAYDPEHDSRANAPIADFRITDNGIDFTESNMNSFLTLDSEGSAGRARSRAPAVAEGVCPGTHSERFPRRRNEDAAARILIRPQWWNLECYGD